MENHQIFSYKTSLAKFQKSIADKDKALPANQALPENLP